MVFVKLSTYICTNIAVCRWQMQVAALKSPKKDDVVPVLDTGIQPCRNLIKNVVF
ncbi:hypothetical protein [Wolbachia endosymbiont of Aedes albopictus]|uniref:hypothetical protein n=1 Tax=Wolbachia endosymbiont of Aedes albopictus TaxID=167957 RepID=UPI0021678FEC|nr:hypothetical protein [Wolbachia endosymbiont of Aedes albopictus]UVW83779.1 hypothetical protein NHG98_05480 [Wolbachia endosymbiont of Aedes albopictus]